MKKSLALSALLVLSLPFGQASAAGTADTYRISGLDRYETSANISFEGWDKSEVAVIATGSAFPDALSATPLAYKYEAPLLLTEKDSLPESVKEELMGLGVSKVFLIGGASVISANVEKELKAMGIQTVTRISGIDRYETSVKIAQEVGITDGLVVASGENFADALSVAPLSAQAQWPILLTKKTELPQSVGSFVNSSNAEGAIVVGGTGAVSDKVLHSLPDPLRLSGADRYETNREIIDFGYDIELFAMDAPFIATGKNFPDALSASALAAVWGNGIVLTDPSNPAQATKATIQDYADLAEEYFIVGGEKALPDSTIEKLFK
ncbi:cell wall-binding repeat-containing protein [Metabacillus idriensis]|uniref:Cell wall-binding repeat 2 family protein n=1 Tax=Metabacillus idriensis TaxID=324768 RepID=A0A6I2MCW6_9BACI|nr:cell wall-binding repeat-containing protein [Metabacillus idriensis]MCM3596133.1 cell wall-binding repeat-containing protein [Metabacillus idriensis]MRX56108.1 cell wall-binding repeat 2 family protein [Metabacillus idriensis]OHR65331.1 hypothetical protein HMPREF3291_03135 [Bacillus sp. HMSC76G11]